MLMDLEEVKHHISEGKLLHIAGAESLLRKLPPGNWIGGSTEYFMTKEGGIVTNAKLFVETLPYNEFTITNYDAGSIHNVALAAPDNGFSIVIIPFDSAVHVQYAGKAADFPEMFMKNIVGWISGVNLGVPGQVPVAVNGWTGEIFRDEAVVLHINAPFGQSMTTGIINIFSPDPHSPVIEFPEAGFSTDRCLVDGVYVDMPLFLRKNLIDTKLPLVGSYSGAGVNVSFKKIENDKVHFYAPVFPDIQYRMAKPVENYEAEFDSRLEQFKETKPVFSCNCILNFLYGELEGKGLDAFYGPITFGEIAYQLVNQTLVYVTVSEAIT